MLNELETLLKSATSPAKIQAYISEHIENAQKDISQWDSTKVRIAIAGESGRGKSSLINAIAGEAIAPVGVTETTQERKEYSWFCDGAINMSDEIINRD
ncbi:MAG: dynamin family protein [Gammaproteobacteria bacterium]|nr:dynamin family protein [Gammaproteobacteria bacterium]